MSFTQVLWGPVVFCIKPFSRTQKCGVGVGEFLTSVVFKDHGGPVKLNIVSYLSMLKDFGSSSRGVSFLEFSFSLPRFFRTKY